MKNLISLSIFIFVLFSFNNLQSQIIYKWYDIPSGVSSNLNSMNSNLIAGDNGKILYRNTNGIFTTIQSGTTSNLYSVISISASGYTNYITGSNGTILYSSNFGLNWLSQNSGTSQNLYSYSKIVKFSNPVGLKNIVVGAGGTILLSSNNGTNWNTISSPYTSDLKSISYCARNLFGFQSAVAVGNSGVIIRTTDAGYNWYSVTSGVVENLNYVYFLDTITGFIAGDNGKILKSINSGVNWTLISSPTNANLTGISFENVNSGWIVGSNGTILKTTNGGNNWIIESAEITSNLRSVYSSPNPIPYENVFAVGDNGKIFNRLCDTLYFPFVKLNGNNILSYFNFTGIFNYKNTLDSSSAGFFWPKEYMSTAVFTTGITTAAYVNNSLRMASCSYTGEYRPGYCISGNFYTDNRFKFYKVKRGDNASNSFDWANWGQMVPYGAPFIDVNNNGIYDSQIDTPGVNNALQTIFVCLTDADYSTHTSSEGFGGGTQPLGAEMHMTAWCYDIPSLMDVQFVKSVIINKSNTPWTKTFLSLVCDPDLGWANDDYIGCDTLRKLGYCYNGTNNDQMYGTAPPAVGFDLLRGGFNRAVVPNVNIGLTSFTYFSNTSTSPPPCESDPFGEAYPAYLLMKGFKKDSTCFLDPMQNLGTSYKKTKYVYPGDPETLTGWTEYAGSIPNCGRDSTGTLIVPNPVGDRRFIMGSGAENFTIVPNESQTIIIAQMIARGANNKISVTKLKRLSDTVQYFYNNNLQIGITPISQHIPESYNLYQNYPNPFNPVTKIKFDIRAGIRSQGSEVKLIIYDITGREIQTLVKEKLNPGTYEVIFDGSNYASGVYFYQLKVGDYIDTKKLVLLK